jgi:hypothetical protein
MSLFNIKGESLQLIPAKVKQTYYKDDKPENTFYVSALILDGYSSQREVFARPLFSNMKQPPLEGETVLLLSTIGSYASGISSNEEMYYLGIINLQGSVHHNSIPNVNEVETRNEGGGNAQSYQTTGAGSTKKQQQAKIDSKFPESRNVKAIQPYVGDVLIEGRFGNSIRLTSTLKSTNVYTKNANWQKGDGTEGDPMLILRASKPTQNTNKVNDFITEDFTKDDSIITLQSTQALNFTPGSSVTDSIKNQSLDSWDKGQKFGGKQILISSGRVVFNSTQNEIIAFAKKGIGLSSADAISLDAQKNIEMSATKILLGKNADEPLIMGNKMKDWMEQLIDAIGKLTAITAVGPSSPLDQSPLWPKIVALKNQFQNNLSQISFTKQSK